MPAAFVQVKFSSSAYDRAAELLDAGQLRQACFQAVKRTTEQGRTDVREEVGAAANLAKKYIDRVINSTLEIRDPQPPIGKITVSHEGLPLIAYRPKVSKKGGVSVRFSNDGTPLEFPHAFRAAMKAGATGDFHDGIFIRRRLAMAGPQTSAQDLINAGFPEGEARQLVSTPLASILSNRRMILGLSPELWGRGIRHMKRLAFGGNFPNVGPKGIAWRLPIKQLMGPSAEGFAETPKIAERIEAKLEERMDKNLNSQIDRFTK